MVARGPWLNCKSTFSSKELIRKAKNGIPVIVATQMMETMITSLTPTRAEVNDVATL
jgi:pyruvate kinase